MAARASSFDPYRTFKFRVRIDTQTIAGVTKVSALARSITPNEVKQGGDLLAPRQNPGAVSYEDVTLERGWSADRSFEEWANAAARVQSDPGGVSHFKRTVYIDVYNLDGNPTDRASTPVASYKLYRCWVSRYSAMPALDADSGGSGIQSITLRHEGFERVT